MPPTTAVSHSLLQIDVQARFNAVALEAQAVSTLTLGPPDRTVRYMQDLLEG